MQTSVYFTVIYFCFFTKYPTILAALFHDRDFEEIPCETEMSEEWSMPLLRNGLGDDSFFIWSDKRIPFVIGKAMKLSPILITILWEV